MTESVETFYDDFSRRFVTDLAEGNERIDHQLDFFSRAVPPDVRAVLVVGCGSGQGAYHLATKVAAGARVLAVDISAENLRMAEALFPDPRIEYRKVDVTREPLDGRFDVIALPDVYEHIPVASRPALHARFNELLTEGGRILFTIPSPGKQESLYASGQGLQVVDEIVTLGDLERVAQDVGGVLSYFNMISVWETNDYAHAVVERGAERVRPITATDKVPLKGWPRHRLWRRGVEFLSYRLRIVKLLQGWRRRQVERRLGSR